MPAERPTIALCMIVRDEAAIIERCLDSVVPLIDTWVVCDTGSTDGTPAVIRKALSEVPGSLHELPWRDFGWNRSELMRIARGAADYLLLLDADMTLKANGSPRKLGADAYLLRHAGALDYSIPRLVRGDREWWFEGSTHEYLATGGDYRQERLDALVVEHHGDGSARPDKLARDARYLEDDLRRDPGNPRATFYLAQTYRDLGDRERALELYRRRVELGGWEEEVFYAAFQVGVLLAERQADEAAEALLVARELRPSRAEPLYELARLARSRGRWEEAYSYAASGLELPYPDDLLFVHRDVYAWGLRLELGIAAYWLGQVELALDSHDRLLADGGLPSDVEELVRENLRLCLGRAGRGRRPDPSPSLAALAPSLELGEIRLDVSPDWPQFNPTIAKDENGFRLIVRTANYRLVDGRYHFLEGDDVIRTLNYVVGVDSELELASVEPLVDRSSGPQRYQSQVEGYEDCRLVRLDETWFATAAVRDRNPEQRCEIALLRLDGTAIEQVTCLQGPSPAGHEKNWMPFVADGLLHVLYSCAPTVVLRLDLRTGACDLLAEHAAPDLARAFRGGSQGVPTDDGFLFVVHEAESDSRGRRYLHRVVLIDRGYRLAAVSRPFRFMHDGVEFCAGLARDGRNLVFAFGVEDRAAGLALASEEEILGLLGPVSGSS